MKAWFDWHELRYGPGWPDDSDRAPMTASTRSRIIAVIGEVDHGLAGGVPPTDCRAGTFDRERNRDKRLATGNGYGKSTAIDFFLDELVEAFWHGAEPRLRPAAVEPIGTLSDAKMVKALKESRARARSRGR